MQVSSKIGGEIVVTTGAKKLAIKVPPSEEETMNVLLKEVVPKICRSIPMSNQISKEEFLLLEPYVDQLIEAGILLPVAAKVTSEPTRQLYTYLARRSAKVDSIYEGTQNKMFYIEAPESIALKWRAMLLDQGLMVADSPRRAFAIIKVYSSESEILKDSTNFHDDKRRWVPVQFNTSEIIIGPWVSPGESACPACNAARNTTEQQPSTPCSSWLSRQPSSLTWIGGILAAQALRAVTPIGPYHPWGTVVIADVLKFEQKKISVWKNPYCRNCADVKSPQAAWSEYYG
ncbi:TOMM precursor leader peptide-binding protein [Actinomyces lilanjuaniae]|uniref:TOMM precursor leader peptide-binding protein n=1 Tax=Actinomyces lilanjuaniae TaxID=2321394 RepID=UPI0013C4C8A1|nr:TOMM precursor leader peptide-binding protein [Actinomyces lilanjuaniae]